MSGFGNFLVMLAQGLQNHSTVSAESVTIEKRLAYGGWIPWSTSINTQQGISAVLDGCKMMSPNEDFRAVDKNGRILDWR